VEKWAVNGSSSVVISYVGVWDCESSCTVVEIQGWQNKFNSKESVYLLS